MSLKVIPPSNLFDKYGQLIVPKDAFMESEE